MSSTESNSSRKVLELAIGMYNAYGERGGWLTWDKKKMPQWGEIDGETQMKWIAAASYATDTLITSVEVTVQEYGLLNISKEVATLYPDVPVMGSHMYKLLYKLAQHIKLKVR